MFKEATTSEQNIHFNLLVQFFFSSKEPKDPDQLYSTLKNILQQVKVSIHLDHMNLGKYTRLFPWIKSSEY